ncbi:MAG: YbjQ family protein [Defluviitaleaceae bacterium]|nr:YbjQ family protein [Defluviitaleaceae bacterium]
MLIVTTDAIPGKNIEALGFVQGSVVQGKHIGKDILAGFKNMAGGEIRTYTDLLNTSQAIAQERMVESAKNLGADAIVCVRIASCSIVPGTSEVRMFGTAVKFI